MRKTSLGVWVVRFIFCVAVIATFKMFDNLLTFADFIGFIFSILSPFVVGGIIAFFLFPICKKIEKLLNKTNNSFIKKHIRGISTAIVYLAAIVIVFSILWLVLPMIYNSLKSFIFALPAYFNQVNEFVSENFNNKEIWQQIVSYIQTSFSFDNMLSFFEHLDFSGYVGGITNIFMSLFSIIIGLIISVYLLLDRASIKNIAIRIGNITIKEKTTSRLGKLFSKISRVIYTFIFGQMMDALVVATIIGILLSIFNIPNSIVLASVYFIFALIPYFGSITGVILVILFSLVSGSINQCIVAGIIALLMQQIDANLINPKIVGHAVGIRPLFVILGITLFGGLLGFAGLILGPPLMAIFIELIGDIIKNREEKKKKMSASKVKEKGIIDKIKESVNN